VEVQINALLDRLPCTTIQLGSRTLPAFRSAGIVGFYAAVLTAITTALIAGSSPIGAVGVAIVAALSFFAYAFARRFVSGTERLVAFEHVWVAFGAVALFAAAAGLPVAPLFDVLAVSLAIFLAVGRVGCALAGCCHGLPSRTGILYPPGQQLPDAGSGERLLPVQLIEASALTLVWLGGLVAARAVSGTATVWFLLTVAVIRFGTDGLRGDARPQLLGVSSTRIMACTQLCAGLVAAEAWLVAGPPGRADMVTTVLLACCAIGGLALVSRRKSTATSPQVNDLDQLDDLVRASWTGRTRNGTEARGQVAEADYFGPV
jgi:prolipoprotein diacylglyceryltransferase